MCFQCLGPERTWQCAGALAKVIGEGGLVVSLAGPLGVGKTVFVKGLAEGLGIDPAAVSSPSFVIVSEYIAPVGLRLAHVDLYRVESGQELEDAGFLDLLQPGVVVAVEWGDRFPEALPEDRLELRLVRAAGGGDSEGTSPSSGKIEAASASELRRIEVRARGQLSAAALGDWRALLASAGLTGLE